MIVFCGELSIECKRFIIKEHKKIIWVMLFFPVVLFSIVSLLFFIFVDWIFIIVFFAVWFMFAIVAVLTPSKNEEEILFPQKIAIIDNTLGSQNEKIHIVRAVSDIKKIIDFGDWYKIVFYFPHKSEAFICQKDLIVEGTIEEFEKLFGEYIIRKNS